MWSVMGLLLSMATTAQAGDGQSLLSHVPKDSMVVVSINVERVKDAPFYQMAMEQMMTDPEVQEMVTKLKDSANLDVQKDIKTFLLSVPADVTSSENFIFFAEGSFDEAKIVDALKSEGADLKEVKHAGTTYQEIDGEGGLAFVDGVAMMGTQKMVKKALSAKAGKGDSVKKHAAISKAMGDLDTSRDLWVAFEFNDELKAMMGNDPTIADLKTLAASLDIKSGLELNVVLTMGSADSASEIGQMAQMQLKEFTKAPEMAQMGLDVALIKSTVSVDANKIQVSLKLNEAEFQSFVASMMSLMQ